MDTIQVTLAITAATIAAAVTFSKAKADIIRGDPTSDMAATLAAEQLPPLEILLSENAATVRQGALTECQN